MLSVARRVVAWLGDTWAGVVACVVWAGIMLAVAAVAGHAAAAAAGKLAGACVIVAAGALALVPQAVASERESSRAAAAWRAAHGDAGVRDE
jgi:hypothetical protein